MPDLLAPTSTARTWQPTLASLFDCWQNFFRGHRSPDTLGRDLLTVVAQATQAPRASLMLFDAEREELLITAAIGLPAAIVSATRVRLGEGIAGWAALHHQPLLLPDGPNTPEHLAEHLRLEALSSALCVPMISDGQLCGVLNLARPGDAPPFTDEDLWFAALVAERQAVALETARLYGELASRERFINRILDSVPISLVVLDRRLRVVSANHNFLLKARREVQQTIGRPIAQVFPPVLLKYLHLEERVQQVFASGAPFDGEKLAYRAPGLSNRTYYHRLIPLKSGSAVDHVLLLMEDITEREKLGEEVRRAERHLASVVDHASDLVVSLTPRGEIVTWNGAAEQASGLPAEQVCGQPFIGLCAVEQRWAVADLLRRLALGEEVDEAEIGLIAAGPEQQVAVAWKCSAMRDDTGKVVGIVAVGRDLSERRRLEAQLVHSAKMVSLGVMAGGIAHELRNPLAVITASAQLLEEHLSDPDLALQCTQRIVASTQRASLIIEHLLKFAHPPQDRYRPINLPSVLEETFTLLNHQLLVSQVALQRDFSPDVPRVYGNPELLQQVFTNLILNACGAMPNGGQLTVGTGLADDHVELRFSDTGCGIAPEHLARIFDPFFTTRPVGQGTGLGLSITYSIIQQHHGQISVASEVGHGTTFHIRLPVHETYLAAPRS